MPFKNVLRCVCAVGCAVLFGCAQALGPLPVPTMPPAPATSAASYRFLGDDLRLCSAVAVGPREALTAAHCTGDGKAGVLSRDRVVVVVLAVEVVPEADLAVLALAPGMQDFKAWARIRAEAPKAGERAMVNGVGCSKGERFDARPVTHQRRGRDLEGVLLDEWAGHACRGDSGGGVFDQGGQLLGVNSRIGKADDGSETLYTAPVEYLQARVGR